MIAVTAHAFSEERDKVLRAGMDDYLTKPVQLVALSSALDRWLGSGATTCKKILAPASASAAPGQPSVTRTPQSAPADDRALLKPGMRRTPRMRELFVAESQDDIDFIVEAEVAGETELLRQRAHRLKGASYAFGAEQLGDLAAEIDSQIKSGQTDVSAQVQKLGSLYEKTVLELDRLTQSEQGS